MGTIDSWSSIETIIRQRLDLIEVDRRYCAVCGRQGSSLSRCFGCQMVYYCGEEHQAEDWSNEHAQKCAQLEWVALGEFIQALPAQPPLPVLGDKWSLSLKEINNWKNWFSIRTNIVKLANNTANIFQKLVHLSDKRQPTHQNAVDGLLAAVTDLLTHVLTIGKAVVYFGLQPNVRPLAIHILSGFNKIDLVGNDQSSSNLPARFHELLNMFPDNKGVELVIVIGDDDQDDSDHIPHAKLKPDRLIITTTGKGRLLDTSEEKRLQRPIADLFVYFNAAHLFSSSNKEQLKSMLTRQRPTLLTFEDEEEFNQAKTFLSTKGINIHQAGTNQFSSLIIRQRLNKPNSTYSTNSYQILLNTMTINGAGERNDENDSLLSRQRPHQSSIGIQHGHTQLQQQQQLNPGLKQVNGKIHIESLSTSSTSSSTSSHNTQANNNGTPLDTNVHIVSTTNTTTPTVQPLVRSNNNIRQPAIVQRQHYSSPTSPSHAITATTYREARPTTAVMMTTIESTRNDYHKPQPKPRLSLVKTAYIDRESIVPQINGSIVQRIKPFFEQSSIISPQEPKHVKQQRQPVSIPYTYQIGNVTKSTCLDDVIPSKKVHTTSPLPPSPVENYVNGRTVSTAAVISSPVPFEIRHDQRAAVISPPVPFEIRNDQRTAVISSPIPAEMRHDQRAAVISPPAPFEVRHDQRAAVISPPVQFDIRNDQRTAVISSPVQFDIHHEQRAAVISPPVPVEIRHDQRAAVISPPVRFEIRHDQRAAMTNTLIAAQIPRPVIERRTDERSIKPTMNSVCSPSTVPIEIQHNQRTVMSTTTYVSSSPSSSSFTENRFDERVVTAIPVNITSIPTPPTETHIEQYNVIRTTTSDSPPPRPPLPPTSNEIIYTEVIKNRERPLSSHHIDLVKSPISPSRSFIIPTKSSSISSKNSSFNFQRPSRPITATNYSYSANKPKPTQSMMTSDRISLYSQRSNKQSDVGVTIKNLSECIDRVGIVFDETNRPSDAPSAGLTTVDLIREQLATASTSKSTGSLLDKLHKSNSSTRLSASSSRTSMNIATPRSKSQQATKTYDEQPVIPKTILTTSPSTSQSKRRTVGVFLPLTPKQNTYEPEQTISITSEQSSILVYQNLEPHTSTINSTAPPPPPQTLDYTLKQHSGPICNGIPKPFRKPTAIIEPSPVITSIILNTSEPNYINLTHQDEHIYTNENGPGLTGSSNSNSYTSKTSSIYSTSDKQNLSTRPETLYAVSNIPSTQQEQSVDYDSFDDELVVDDIAKIEKPLHSNDNTDDDSFDDDDENKLPIQSTQSKNPSTNFFRSTLNRLTRSNKSLERLNNEPSTNDYIQETNPSNIIDTKTKKTLRSIKARHEAKKTGNLSSPYTGDDDTTSIDSNCSTQTATSLNKTAKSSHNRFRLFRRKVEKEFASDTEAEKHQTEQRRKKFNKKILNETANELKTKRLLMMSDDDDDENLLHLNQQQQKQKQDLIHDEPHIYDHIIHDEINNNSSRMGKLSNETYFKPPTVTLDEIRSEIQAEIAARQDIHINTQPMTSSNLTLQKKRSKSVTFLDELLGDDPKQKQTNKILKADLHIKPSTAIKRIEKGDARSICGALTGTGPIRGIIKAGNNDITGTTAPVSPSAAASIYLTGTSVDTRCTSPKVHERTHRPLSTYTVGSARFYDGASVSSTPAPPLPPPPPAHSFNQNNNISNQRPILNNTSHQSTSDNNHHKRPTAKVSPFQTKSPNDPSSSSPVSTRKQTPVSSTSKKPIRPTLHRNMQMSHDVATPSISDGVGGVSKRLQSNF